VYGVSQIAKDCKVGEDTNAKLQNLLWSRCLVAAGDTNEILGLSYQSSDVETLDWTSGWFDLSVGVCCRGVKR